MHTPFPGARLPFWAGILTTFAIGGLAVAPMAYAAGPPPVGLGTAAPFAVLAGTPAVTNTGPTSITGDLGISPGSAVTGFPPGTVTGTVHAADAVAVQSQTDLTTAYTVAEALPVTATHGTLGGLTLVGGVYNAGGVTLDLTGTLTLDGQNDPSSVWVFQATSDLVTASSSSVNLINGASPCNVFWQVTSSATLGSGSTFVGTIMALTSITMADGVVVNGRALARNGQVTLINDSIDASACSAPTASPTPAPTASPTPVSGIPNTAYQGDPASGSLPLFLAMVALLVLLLTLAVDARWHLAKERDRD
ncbi:MAG TPA: ice-binding family protein [Gemmatimonadales bacterium]|nr:ice-binding family protein [Gemmatimonadales bacterium]